MKLELSEEEREALYELLWCVNHDMPTRMAMESVLRHSPLMKYRDDAVYSQLERRLGHNYRRLEGSD